MLVSLGRLRVLALVLSLLEREAPVDDLIDKAEAARKQAESAGGNCVVKAE